MRDRLCYSLLPHSAADRTRSFRPTACAFGLFPEISTPVEKTVENRRDLLDHSAICSIFAAFTRRPGLKNARNRDFSPTSAADAPENRSPLKANPAEARFC